MISVSVYPPTCVDLTPVVEVAVATHVELDKACDAAAGAGDLLLPFRGYNGFQVATGDVLCHVWLEE